MAAEFVDESATPWSTLGGIGALRLHAVNRPVRADIRIPGSKSLSNRALIIAAMSDGTARLSGLLRSDDTYWCLDALRRLGVRIDFDRTGNAIVRGIGRTRPRQGHIYVGSAGTVARFLPPLLAAGDYGKWRITASSQMSGRPMEPLFQALADGGATVSFLDREGCFPVMVTGDTFSGGQLRMSGSVSSQFISGILMGAPQSRHGVVLDIDGPIVQSDYVRITLDVMRHFGLNVDPNQDLRHFDIAPSRYRSRDLDIEADASTSTYFAALAAATGGRIALTNLGQATRQP
ncbi:MAG TPA: 3-phosphoshikimate 1-carboxyvinyltransferase, partial [Blastocatellia bacterium]